MEYGIKKPTWERNSRLSTSNQLVRGSAINTFRLSTRASRGFTPTPILVLFRFLKILSLVAVTSVQELISAKNFSETKKPHQNWCRGFTLIETMVAISILFIAVTGPIALMGKATLRTYYAKDEMVAINLAQEGVEAVRQKRDSNMLKGAPTLWDEGITAGIYIFDARAMTVTSCPACDTKVYQDTDGYYRQLAGVTITPFTRTIIITDIGGGGIEKKIVSTATWQTGGTTGSVDVTNHIFKQFP